MEQAAFPSFPEKKILWNMLETPVLPTFGNLGVSQFSLRLSKPIGCRAVPTNAGRTQAAPSAAVSATSVAAGTRGWRDIGAGIEKIKSMAAGCTSCILVRFPIIKQPFWGTPMFGNLHISFNVNESPVVFGWTKQQEQNQRFSITKKTCLLAFWPIYGVAHQWLSVQNTTSANYGKP